MLAFIGALAVLLLLALILTDRASPLVALILVPVAAAVVAGAGGGIPADIIAGITKVAPVAGMFVFAILFFGIMTDVGLLAPLVALLLQVVGERPTRIAMGTAALALLIHLDGSGAVCFLVTIPALRPVYDRLGMDRRVLACTASMAAGINFLPWSGPTLRAAVAVGLPAGQVFAPMLAVQVAGLVFLFAASWWLGHREEIRLAGIPAPRLVNCEEVAVSAATSPGRARLLVNLAITLLVVGTMIAGRAEPVVVFLIGTAVALAVNYTRASEQRARIDAHARAAILMVSILIAAGAFTGIMTGSGMIDAMAKTATAHLPSAVGGHLPVIVGVLGMPLSMVFDPDSFYFGVLPVIAQTARDFGTDPVLIARAALLGQMTTGFPVSPLTPATFLVAGLSGVDLGTHQRFAIPWLFAASMVMLIAALVMGKLPL